jgi:predicted nucleic acid-binding protein
MKFALADTNILLRFFTGEPLALAERARELVEQAENGRMELQIPSLIVAETIYTLESFYEIPRESVCEKFLVFLRSRGISPVEPDILFNALERYRALPVHFADAYLAATAFHRKMPVYSFDKDFGRFKDVDWKQ